MLPYTIRPMKHGDIPTVVDIDRLSFPAPWSSSSYAYELGHNSNSIFHVLLRPPMDSRRSWRRRLLDVTGLGKRKSPVIGYMGFRLRKSSAHISTIAIHPEWRGQGLGELLLLRGLEVILAKGFTQVTLEVRASNHVAQRLYRKYGFRFTGVHQGYYRDGEDAWLMQAQIDKTAYQTRLSKLRYLLETRLCPHQSGKSAQTHLDEYPQAETEWREQPPDTSIGQNIRGGL